ncbi:S1 RNA-binding domain-containing protein [Mycoplasma procyoni]|uniref:S1 RNA-binding domain-containing protein n=1 Tax=Mycoplasma procyoni TaxID=568784 RepID=UPI00197BBA10|nr:S1 RNA-binding domain-containing protein [Mycoplasma procyoni]MBN3534828.1 S1 RNA-binding domain-containing protein [Mycoplasma procyoni]
MNAGDIVVGRVKNIFKNYFWVDIDDDYQGVVFINEVSDYFVKDLHDFFKLGDYVKLKIINVNHYNKKMSLSFKALNPKLLKNPFNYKICETDSGFENLFKHALKEVEEWKK